MLTLLDDSLTGAWHHVHGQVALAQAGAEVKAVAAARRQGVLFVRESDICDTVSTAQVEELCKTASDPIRRFDSGLTLKFCN